MRTTVLSSTVRVLILVALLAGQYSVTAERFEPTWESIRANYKTPQWFIDAKFGIMMHWGLYSVPAHQSEWYAKHMYNDPEIMKWHQEHYGPQDKFGYKDFIPLFRAEKFDPDAWAQLFKKAGAKYIIPTAEHHDGFALWDSKLTKWDAKDMGPHRDLIGDLAASVRKVGLKFGVSNHRMEHWSFMYPKNPDPKFDLFDPAYADFYGPPHEPKPGEDVMSGRGAPQSKEFLDDWAARNEELIDKYRPDILWFDNGVNDRALDPIKLRVAAYYYNSAVKWKKQVSLSTKSDAYLFGSIKDYERQSRAPQSITDFPWQVDDPVLNRFGFTEGSPIASARTVIDRLVENVSKNGALLLNISPKADGTIPDDQQKLLLQVGAWLDVNGDAVYSTHAWTKWSEGEKEEQIYRFTAKKGVIYAFGVKNISSFTANIRSLAKKAGKDSIISVELLDGKIFVPFQQDTNGLTVSLPSCINRELPFVLKITTSKK